ncbi:MAG: hypothetical protein P4N59_18225 [Negativicutes bacterium]|nr:hypothetical protein [Negativicutes bacterium]
MIIKPLPRTPNLPSAIDDGNGASLIRTLFGTLTGMNTTINQLVGVATTENWQTADLTAGWANFGAPYSQAAYYKDSGGIVHLGGVVKGGAAASVIFTLPVGSRPSYRQILSGLAGGDVACRIDVYPDGSVKWVVGGTSAYVALDGIRFRAD